MMVVVHDKDFVGAHHEGINISVFLLQLLKEDVWRTVAHKAEETPDDGQRGEAWRRSVPWHKSIHLLFEIQHSQSYCR